jgi:hypothetical protein
VFYARPLISGRRPGSKKLPTIQRQSSSQCLSLIKATKSISKEFIDYKEYPTMANDESRSNTTNEGKSSWKSLEEYPMLWWLGLDVWKNPANVLLISSIPFCAGAYFGYRKPTEKLEELVGKGKKGVSKAGVPTAEYRRLGIQTAGRALRLGTLGAFGAFGMLGAGKH